MRGKILIVEDFADWRDLLQGILQREGHQVESVATAEEARTYLDETSDLDLAILDVRLVETDESNEEGMRLLAEIHRDQPYTCVIMVSGHGTMELQRKAFRDLHAFDFFRKEQFASEEFRKTVREAVEEATRSRQAAKDTDYMRGHRFQQWQRRMGA